MTDFSLPHTTHTAPFLDSVLGTSGSHSTTKEIPNGNSAEDEEDYTIKCICDFQDDDGNTVFCETCETWQHIECYYPGKEPPEVHNCADCEQVEHRHLNGNQATQRQKDRRHLLGLPTDRKTKKQSTKSHKKRVKAPELTNGWAHDNAPLRNGNGKTTKDQPPPTKRHKTSHRPSNSMHATNNSSNHVSHSSKRSISASHIIPSPSKTPSNHTSKDATVEQYSHEFLHLYDDDPGDTPMQANLFNDIAITGSLSTWSHDVEAVISATNGRTHQEIFMRCEQSVDEMNLPQLQKKIKIDNTVEHQGMHPKWTYLATDSFIPQNSIVGELRGKIGHMQDYVQESSNRWEYLRHPVPFVFFHPHLPIYIDTRREGSTCRYLRRSCRPNVSIKTILENGSDYHFCLLTNSDLEADTELTIAWTLDEHVRAYFHQLAKGVKVEGSADTDESYVMDYVGKVLADFGECACDGPDECTMARYDHRKIAANGDSGMNGTRKKARKSPHNSSRSTARTTTSRSGSEAVKQQEDDDEDDSRSTSASVRSKPHSRDLTPSNGIEITDREKRKIAAADKLSQLAQEKPAPTARKRNRTSGGSTSITPTTTTFVNRFSTGESQRQSQPNTPTVPAKPRYVDTSTSRRQSGSPITKSPLGPPSNARSTSQATYSPVSTSLRRSVYVDSSMQTDPDPEFDDVEMADAPPRKPIMSFTKRMLVKCHKERLRLDEEKKSQLEAAQLRAQIADDSKGDSLPEATAPETKESDGDVVMQGTDLSPTSQASEPSLLVEKPRPPDASSSPTDDTPQPLPSPLSVPRPAPAPPDRKPSSNGHRPTDLRVQLPEPKPPQPGPITPSITHTPTSITTHSPVLPIPTTYPSMLAATTTNATLAIPSPIKKKLSLGDYMNRRSSLGIIPDTSSKKEPSALGSLPVKSNTSPVMSSSSLRLLPTLAEEVKVSGVEGNGAGSGNGNGNANAIVETPKVESGDPMLGVQSLAPIAVSASETGGAMDGV